MKRNILLVPSQLVFGLLISLFSGLCYGEGPDANPQVEMNSPSSSFEAVWDAIRKCSIQFISPGKGEETLEDGHVYKYLQKRGYSIYDSGDGYFKVDNVNETFHGYKVTALTLPGEWGVYGMDLAADISKIRSDLFPDLRFKTSTDKLGNQHLSATLSQDSTAEPAVFLALQEKKLKSGNHQTTIFCRIEYGD